MMGRRCLRPPTYTGINVPIVVSEVFPLDITVASLFFEKSHCAAACKKPSLIPVQMRNLTRFITIQ